MSPEFHYTLLIAKPLTEVWSALTEKKMIDRFYMAPVHTLELKEGGKIKLRKRSGVHYRNNYGTQGP